jgi:hypothetical protein
MAWEYTRRVGGGVSVTETAGNGADVRAGSDQLSGAEMT